MKFFYTKYLISLFILFFYTELLLPQEETKSVKIFEIDEININIQGLKTFNESDLINILGSKKGEIFDIDSYMKDAERIKKYYFDNGFFDTTVDTNLVFNYEDEEVIENFKVRENTRYVYYKTEYNGLDSVPEDVKKQVYNPDFTLLRTGSYYSKDTIKLEVNRILTILFNSGYAMASAEIPDILKIESNEEFLKGKVNVYIEFSPKLQYTFGNTGLNIKGKRYNLSNSDIYREITYTKGKLYNKSEVLNSELNLTKITLLDNPRITIDSLDSISKQVNFIINSTIGNKYELTPELFGYYIENSFYLGTGISFSDKYFFGGGRTLTSSARIYFNSIENNRFEFLNVIYQPFLFNNRNIAGNWNIGIQYNIDEESNVTQIKNSIGITYDLPNYTFINRINTNWDIINQRIILKKSININDTLNLDAFSLNYFESLIGLTLIHNTVNNITFPYDGTYQSFTFEESGLFGYLVKQFFNTQTASYFKLSNFNSSYLNLSENDKIVPAALAGKLYSGIILEYGENNFIFQGQELQGDRVPTDTRFLCGGSTSIRGWGAKQLGIVVDKDVGGNFIVETSLEYRLRPFLTSENTYIRDIGFTGFVDIGNSWSKINKFKFNQLAFASGGGIRYYTIVGAVRLDVGFKIYDPQPGPVGGSNWIFGPGSNFSDKYHLQFGIGNTF